MKTEFKVEGFHCKSCKMLVEDTADDFPEIKSCRVDLKTGKVTMECEEYFEVSKFKKEIESLGNYRIKS